MPAFADWLSTARWRPGEDCTSLACMEWVILVLVVVAFGPIASIVIVQGIEMMTMKRRD
ncbi:MAG: hypothetical protein NVS3B20_13620 [Polyangiales bacterium]